MSACHVMVLSCKIPSQSERLTTIGSNVRRNYYVTGIQCLHGQFPSSCALFFFYYQFRLMKRKFKGNKFQIKYREHKSIFIYIDKSLCLYYTKITFRYIYIYMKKLWNMKLSKWINIRNIYSFKYTFSSIFNLVNCKVSPHF